jgi:hypothetical protein
VLAARFAAEPLWRRWALVAAAAGVACIVFIAAFGVAGGHGELAGLWERAAGGVTSVLTVAVLARLAAASRLAAGARRPARRPGGGVMAPATQAAPPTARRRNRRGEGGRLREEIITAASPMIGEADDDTALTLRGAARRLGIAAPSIYRHFPDVDQLKMEVVQRAFADFAPVPRRRQQ